MANRSGSPDASDTAIHINLASIQRARDRIAGAIRRTPLEQVRWTGGKHQIFFKMECLQVTGSFKARGAFNSLSLLSPEARRRGILTVSAGNHGLAVAYSSELLAVASTIVVSKSASRAKVDAIKRYPVTLIEAGDNYDESEREARILGRQSDRTFISPYNDPEVIAGQGTVALEILEDQPAMESLVVPTGGGGLLAGVAIAAKALSPGIKVYGVEPVASPTMTRSLEAGKILRIKEDPTIADGLAGNIEEGSITFPIIQRLVDGMILVEEEEIRAAMRNVARYEHLIVEGSGAVAVAALSDPRLRGTAATAILTGRNISLDVFLKAVQD